MNAPRDEGPRAALSGLSRVFEAQRAACARDPYPAAAVRRDRLTRLIALIADEQPWIDAIDRDFGHRSAHETRLAELYVVSAEARHARRQVARWMRAQRVSTPLRLWPRAARLLRPPRGRACVTR